MKNGTTCGGGNTLIAISNQYAGKRVRIRGIVPMPDGKDMLEGGKEPPYILGQGDHVGDLINVESDVFTFKDNHGMEVRLRVKMWRIAEILPTVVN
jgi:hypothetical protein